MLDGKVLRANSVHASLTSLDTSAAEKIPDVTVVRDGDFVGVAAPNEATAVRALTALRAQWNAPQQVSDSELFEHLRTTAKGPDQSSGNRGDWGRARHAVGSVEQGRASASKTLAQTYTVAYIAHAPLEPRAACRRARAKPRSSASRRQLGTPFSLPLGSVCARCPWCRTDKPAPRGLLQDGHFHSRISGLSIPSAYA